MTSTIQPPLLAWAWRIAVGDPRSEPRIARHHEWLRANRDLEGDGLLWLDPARRVGARLLAQVRPGLGLALPRRARVPAAGRAQSRRCGWDARRIRDRRPAGALRGGHERALGLSRLAAGEPSITPALVDRLWDERAGLFLDEAQPGGARPAVDTWPRWPRSRCPTCPRRSAAGWSSEHLLDPSATGCDDPAALGRRDGAELRAQPRPGWKLRYWRGPTWINAAWLLWLGMLRLGYEAEARADGRAAGARMVEREGLREYYDPRTGEGLGAREFAWSSLIAGDGGARPGAASQLERYL